MGMSGAQHQRYCSRSSASRTRHRIHASHPEDRMLDALRALFTGRGPVEPDAADASPEIDPIHVAACALLLEIAWADNEFSAPERAHLEGVLARHFQLTPEEGARLMAVADEARRNAVDYYRFTSVLRKSYDTGQKMVM